MSLVQIARGVWRCGAGRPRAAIIGGVHGNELTGVRVVQKLVQLFSEPGNSVKGELTLIVANPDAVDAGVRFLEDDLNRCFGEGLEDLAGSMERRRAIELAPFIRNLDAMVDLHATNKPSEPFVRLPGPMEQEYFSRCEQLFLGSLPPQCNTVLWDPRELIAGGSMTDEFALRHAPQGTFICYEAGLASDVTAVPATELAVQTLLAKLGMLDTQTGVGKEVTMAEPCAPREWKHYKISDVFRLDEDGFEWANGHGESNFERVPAGEVFGRQGSRELSALEESFIVFPKVSGLWALGRPLGWLATLLPRDALASGST
mmetsp:Transcript_14977/g.32935  ORF Transcript_14977/g.32935 Transcript_14977/m.32935 type:complete len:316 (+) Transcript_14977:56-1003(+)